MCGVRTIVSLSFRPRGEILEKRDKIQMMDLRKFLDKLETEGELHTIEREVDPKHELGAICKILNERPNGPAVLFENVKGSKIPVIGKLLARDRKSALALGLSQENVFEQ